MTPKEKLIAIKKAEEEFFYKVSLLKRDYRLKVKELTQKMEAEKLAQVKKDLGI